MNSIGGAGYSEHFKEIERRAEASKEGESVYFEKKESSGSDLPFKIPDQKHLVFSLSTESIPPKSVNKLQPALRIYGMFSQQVDAKEHCEFIQEYNKNCSLFIDESLKWIIAPSSFEKILDAKYVESTTKKILQEYLEKREDDNKEFEQSKQGEDVERTIRSMDNEVDDVPVVNETSKSHILKGNVHVKDQNYAAIVILPNSKEGEFIFQCLGCFSTIDEADRWVLNVASREITHFDIHIVSTGQWIYPNRMDGDGAGEHKYRTPELQKIMDRKRAAPAEVKQFEQFMSEQPEKAALE
jgi:hypothetical protein